jgi:hypothetical protein
MSLQFKADATVEHVCPREPPYQIRRGEIPAMSLLHIPTTTSTVFATSGGNAVNASPKTVSPTIMAILTVLVKSPMSRASN